MGNSSNFVTGFESIRDGHNAYSLNMSTEMADHVARFVNAVSKRRLGKLDCYTILHYLRSTDVSQASLLTALVFIEKISIIRPAPELLEHITAIDLFIVALMMASKYLHDVGTNDRLFNADWASLSNRDLSDLNKLEIHFLTTLNWTCFIERAEYERILSFYRSISKPSFHLPSLSKHLTNLTRRHRFIGRKTRTTARLLTLLSVAYLTASDGKTDFQTNNPIPTPCVDEAIINPQCSNDIWIKACLNNTLLYGHAMKIKQFSHRIFTSPSNCPNLFPINNTYSCPIACGA